MTQLSRSSNNIFDRTPAVDLDDCGTQRPITENGCRIAAAFPKRPHVIELRLMYVANIPPDRWSALLRPAASK